MSLLGLTVMGVQSWVFREVSSCLKDLGLGAWAQGLGSGRDYCPWRLRGSVAIRASRCLECDTKAPSEGNSCLVRLHKS